MAINGRLTNVMGIKMPFWIINQLDTRSKMAASTERDNDNLKFVSDKSAWIRLVSSINIPLSTTTEEESAHFKYYKTLDPSLSKPDDLAKNYVLFGGTSAFQDKAYYHRSGFHNLDDRSGGSYGMLGDNEVKRFGYRPMPGIVRATIDTAGKLGAIRQATIDIKCWNKQQLDIIDALYLKLGYTMFLEWGHTMYYENMEKEGLSPVSTKPQLKGSEMSSLDPFKDGITKEEIALEISKRARSTYGNYDGMLGMVTNFSFSVNQEGGYDCQLRLMGLGVLGDSLRINNPSNLISIFKDEVLLLSKTLQQMNPGSNSAQDEELKKLKANLEAAKKDILTAQKNYDELVNKFREEGVYNIPLGPRFVETDPAIWGDAGKNFRNENYNSFYKINDAVGEGLFLPKFKTFLPTGDFNFADNVSISLDTAALTNYFTNLADVQKVSWVENALYGRDTDGKPRRMLITDLMLQTPNMIASLVDYPTGDMMGYRFLPEPKRLGYYIGDSDKGIGPVSDLLIYNNFYVTEKSKTGKHRLNVDTDGSPYPYQRGATSKPIRFSIADNRLEPLSLELYADTLYEIPVQDLPNIEKQAAEAVAKIYNYTVPADYDYQGSTRIAILESVPIEAKLKNQEQIVYDIPNGFIYFGRQAEPSNDNTYQITTYRQVKFGDNYSSSGGIQSAILNAAKSGKMFSGAKLVDVSERLNIVKTQETRTAESGIIDYYVIPLGPGYPENQKYPKGGGYAANTPVKRFYFTVLCYAPIRVQILVAAKDLLINSGTNRGQFDRAEKTARIDVDINYPVYLTFSSTGLITSMTVNNNSAPSDPSKQTKSQEEQVKELEKSIAQAKAQQSAALIQQVNEALAVQSNLETTLRTIEVSALNRAGVSINTIKKISLSEKPRSGGIRTIADVIFTNGCYDSIIDDLISGNINDEDYLKSDATDWQKFKVRAKYGFATTLMGSDTIESATEKTFDKLKDKHVDYGALLNAYVAPYKISSNLLEGIQTTHPVYIPFGLLLMILNHSCLLYEESGGVIAKDGKPAGKFKKPLVYLDYNTKLNFFQTCPQQMSTNPWVVLMKLNCTRGEFAEVFDVDVLNADKKQEATKIVGQENKGGTRSNAQDLFDPNSSSSSKTLPDIVVSGESKNTGYLMNILLNVSYLVECVRDNAAKNGSNGVFLKPFLEDVIFTVNKYLGDFNAFRLFYSEKANTFQIVDDQCTYTTVDEMVNAKPERKKTREKTTNTTEIPLYGKYSIARSMQIKSEMSSKVANLLAISANSTDQQAQNSDNGDSVGFISEQFVDRTVTKRLSGGGAIKSINGEILASQQYNSTIKDFYSKLTPSKNDVSQATSFLIDKISKVKNQTPALRGTAMIPLGVEFTTDGISGMSMYQTFTVSNNLLPHSYVAPRKGLGYIDNQTIFVGFVVTGLTHFIEGNSWTTSVRSSMVGVKSKDLFVKSTAQEASNEDPPVESEDWKTTVDELAWSGMFISYVMTEAGLRFPVKEGDGILSHAGANHPKYLMEIRRNPTKYDFTFIDPNKNNNPRPGDLVIHTRQDAKQQSLSTIEDFDALPNDAARINHASHCDIIASISSEGQYRAYGGNLSDSVSRPRYTRQSKAEGGKLIGYGSGGAKLYVYAILRPTKLADKIVEVAKIEYDKFNPGGRQIQETEDDAKELLRPYYEPFLEYFGRKF